MAGEEDIAGSTGVFIDHEDFPIPRGLNPFDISDNIESALEDKGYCGNLGFWVYVEKPRIEDRFLQYYKDAGIHFLSGAPGGNDARAKSVRAKFMIRDILLWAVVNRDRHPLNLIVVSNYIPQEKNLVGVLQDLQSRDYRVLLVQKPSDTEGSDKKKLAGFDTEDLEWLWINLFEGRKKPIDDESGSSEGNVCSACQKAEVAAKAKGKATAKSKGKATAKGKAAAKPKGKAAAKPIAKAAAKPIAKAAAKPIAKAAAKPEDSKTLVFWDVDDCPNPVGLNPGSAYQNIKSALEKMGYRGAVSIKVYDKNESLHKYLDAEIDLFQGDKDARVEKMLWDILLLGSVDNYKGANLFVILKLSEDTDLVKTPDYTEFIYTEFVKTLGHLKERRFNVVLAQPDVQIASEFILRSVSSVWLSTNLLDEGNPVVLCGINFADFDSAKDMEVLGTVRLKRELQSRGLKCGGTLPEQAARLFLLKSTPLDKLPKELLAEKKK